MTGQHVTFTVDAVVVFFHNYFQLSNPFLNAINERINGVLLS